MGTDKALLEIDGVPLAAGLRRVLLAAGAEQTIAVGGDLVALDRLGFDTRADAWPGEGPLGGLVVGLEQVRSPIAVVLACDLPRLTADVVADLVAQLESVDADAVVPVVDGRPQPLAAAYRTTVAPALRGRFEAGERSLRGGLAAIRVHELAWYLDPVPFLDVDTPDDLDTHGRHGSGAERRG